MNDEQEYTSMNFTAITQVLKRVLLAVLSKNNLTKLLAYLSFLIPAFFATNFTLNYFYVTGGGLFDGGWFAYLSSFSTQFPPKNPMIIERSFFDIHISPIFYLFSGINALLEYAGFHLPYAVFFSVTQGVWFGLISLACYSLFLPPLEKRAWKHIALAFLYSLMVMLSGINLSIVIFPHIEIAIPALLLSFFALLLKGHKKSSLIPLFIGLLIREDAGLDYFGFLILLSCCCYCLKRDEQALALGKYFLKLALYCLVYACAVIVMQRLFFHPSTMSHVYLGSPPFRHVTQAFMIERLTFIWDHRLYLFAPMFFLCLLGIRYRNMFIAVGVMAVLPWVIFSFFALSLGASSLRWYHAFPLVVTLFWPAVIYALNDVIPILKKPYCFYWVNAALIVCISTFLFCTMSREDSMRKPSYPWHLFGTQWTQQWKKNQETLDIFFEKTPINKQTIISMSIVALELDKIRSQDFQGDISHLSDEQIKKVTLVIYQPNNRDYKTIAKIAEKAGLTQHYQLSDSSYWVAKSPKAS